MFALGLISFAFGLLFGSFFNVCIYRIPEGTSIAFPPSHCSSCSHQLGALDLVPVLSRFFLKGKCRYCGAPISFRYTVVELLTAVFFALIALRFGFTLDTLLVSVLVSVLIIVSFIDFDHTIIPNGPLLFAAAAGLGYAFFHGGAMGLVMAFLGALCGAVPLLLMDGFGRLFFKKEGMGLGDVKLMAAVGLFLGWKLTLFSLLAAVWVCTIWIVILVLSGRRQSTGYIPFGPFLSIGCLIAIFCGEGIIGWYLSLLV